MTILDKIVENKKKEVALAKKRAPLKVLIKKIAQTNSRGRSLKKSTRLQLIAEIKPKSPSAGTLRSKVNVARLAKEFEKNSASAISVLTDKKYFGGSLKNLSKARKSTSLPLLRKEFIVDKYQVYESRAAGADMVLLIAAVLKNRIKDFAMLAMKLNLQPLIEVHTALELKSVLGLIKPSEKIVIGINNRNLKTLEIDFKTSLRLVKQIPGKFIKISESGIFEVRQLKKLSQVGFDGVLIGTGLVKNPRLFDYF